MPCAIYHQLPAAYYLAARFHNDFESAILHAVNGGGQNQARAILTGAQTGLSNIPKHRWVHITMVGYGLVQMLSCLSSHVVDELCQHSPWRKQNPKTAGQIRKGLTGILRHVAVRQWWNAKCKKFMPPNWDKNRDPEYEWIKAT